MSSQMKLTLVGGTEVKGSVYCIDPVSKAIVLKDEDGAYSLINADAVTKLDGKLDEILVPDPVKMGLTVQLDDQKIREREVKAMMLAEKEIESRNFNVNTEVQQLFDRIRNIFPCTWDGVDICVLDSFLISDPYDTVRVRPGHSDNGLERLKKVLAGERSKLNM